jgi:tRNA threonylcarbamoyladenosine biosynthesis protein TsaB
LHSFRRFDSRPYATLNVIGFDTATDDTAVAASVEGELVFSASVEASANGRPQHATRLLVEVEKAASAAGGWGMVQRIAVGVGPGSFTGLRIGIATAKSLAQSLGLELAPVGTLAALAHGSAGGEAEQPLLAVLDARRGETFAALYEASGEQLWEPFVAPPAQLAERLLQLPRPPLATGSGAVRFRDELLAGAEIPGDSDPRHRVAAGQVCALGASLAAASPEDVLPIYLRRPDAERWRERDGTDN